MKIRRMSREGVEKPIFGIRHVKLFWFWFKKCIPDDYPCGSGTSHFLDLVFGDWWMDSFSWENKKRIIANVGDMISLVWVSNNNIRVAH